MKRIEYRITFGDGNQYIQAVLARDINSGFRKVTAIALRDIKPNYDIHSIEFWMVTS